MERGMLVPFTYSCSVSKPGAVGAAQMVPAPPTGCQPLMAYEPLMTGCAPGADS